MAYKVLYRKYRPQDFNNLYGQENIKKILIDSIINDKISHAYLFSGPRGTGKTSTAKLFAKAINCEKSENGIPCNNCEACLNYENSPDIIEIDAASNNGVDEIRDLRENANILPTYSKYKIYIIDEVHMLSQSAWNAFLKRLEEPPKHIIFILATTEIQKIPITIMSRCQRFSFQKISDEIIKENILRISKIEKIKITEEAANLISILADGGMRDALSILDQLSKENTEITKKTIEETFGILTENEIEDIFSNIETGNIEKINSIFNEYFKKGLDINLLISKIINYLYNMEIAILQGNSYFLTISEIKSLSNDLINCYNKSDALNLIKINLVSYIKHIHDDNKNVTKKENVLETNIDEEQEKSSKVVNYDELKKIRLNNSFVDANKEEKNKFKKLWQSFELKEKSQKNSVILSLIEDINIEVVSKTNILFSHKSASTTLLFNESLEILEEEFYKIEKIHLNFICLSEKEWQVEKKKYIESKNKIYKYIEEKSIEKYNNSDVVNQALDIFDKDFVEIN